jgi:hypothetical protein
VKRNSSDAHQVTPPSPKKYEKEENLFRHNYNILVRKRFGKSIPQKGSTYTGTFFTRPKTKIIKKMGHLVPKLSLLLRCDEGKSRKS